LPENINEHYFIVSWININGTVFKPGMVDIGGIFRFFGLIQYIIKIYILIMFTKKMETLKFSQHVHAFEVVRTDI